jgi:hypothetical protein
LGGGVDRGGNDAGQDGGQEGIFHRGGRQSSGLCGRCQAVNRRRPAGKSRPRKLSGFSIAGRGGGP